MSDLIERQDVIDALELGLENDYVDATELLAYVKQLPSAEPERKKGRWQRRKGSDCWECSTCHAVLESDDIVMHNFYYCYHCGTDMMNEDGFMNLEGTEHE